MIRAMSGHVQVNLAVQDADDEAAARSLLTDAGVPLDHVHFFHIEHGDIWARDMGPQFTRSRSGRLRINDWNFNMWGYEEPDSDSACSKSPSTAPSPPSSMSPCSTRERDEHRRAHDPRGRKRDSQRARDDGRRRIRRHSAQPGAEPFLRRTGSGDRLRPAEHLRAEPGLARLQAPRRERVSAHAGRQENHLGPHRRRRGQRNVPWRAGAAHPRAERERHRHPHAGVYTLFTTNGHPDEFLRFVAPDKVVLAEAKPSRAPAGTPVEELLRWLEEQNHARLERVYDIISRETTESGEPIQVVRIPMPELTLDVFQPGDGTYDYFAAYDRWEDGSTLPEVMLASGPRAT